MGDLSAPGTIELVILKVLCKGSLKPASDGQKRNFAIAAGNSFTFNFGVVKVIVTVSGNYQACTGTFTLGDYEVSDNHYLYRYQKPHSSGNSHNLIEIYKFRDAPLKIQIALDPEDSTFIEAVNRDNGCIILSANELEGNKTYSVTCRRVGCDAHVDETVLLTIKTGATYKDPITVNVY